MFAVTNLRVMREEGLVRHRSSATMLGSLSDVRMSASLLGRQLGYGDLIIYSQSGDAGVDRFLMITDAEGFKNAIMSQKAGKPVGATVATPTAAAAPVAATAPVALAPVAPVSDPAAALASLADLRDRGAITNEEFEAKKVELLARI